MEFWGFIYDKRYDKRDVFDFVRNTKENDEHSINSESLKKYFVNGKWIFSTSLEYLKTVDLRKYIKRADCFARILFSSELKILKFDYLEKGVFKKQLVIENGQVKVNIGFEISKFNMSNINEIFDNILWEIFRLDCEFIEPHESYFQTIKNVPRKTNIRETAFDFYLILSIPQALVGIIFTPFLITFTSWLLYLIITNRELWKMQTLFLILFAWSISLLLPIYIGHLIYTEIRNYLNIKNKVLKDDVITLPNNSS